MSLSFAQKNWGWPPDDDIFNPHADGAKVQVRLANEKIGSALRLKPNCRDTRVGILAADPESSDAPIAIVCSFTNKVSAEVLREAHRLAWNFGRAPVLITIEPHLFRTWSCCEPPSPQEDLQSSSAEFNLEVQSTNAVGGRRRQKASQQLTSQVGSAIEINQSNDDYTDSPSAEAAASLQWIALLSGRLLNEHPQKFNSERRAERMLLANLLYVRQKLRDAGLDEDVCHDLLARVIFIQFLFDRKDDEGQAALNPEKLAELQGELGLSQSYETFGQLLNHPDDAYRLFTWLNGKFNGDLFEGVRDGARRQQEEPHLKLLAHFVNSDLEMKSGQFLLWRDYAFDAIPLDVISTIYEQFVKRAKKDGVHYTPSHVADLLLDTVLPWQGTEWDLKVLDPACGSGVFLVKAYQRLIQRWKNAHNMTTIGVDTLQKLLVNNLFGVDLSPHAVRVASFSLYLAMCDEIDPRHYWTQVKFPPLRGDRLIGSDFFAEVNGIRTEDSKMGANDSNRACYDIIIGNPPWGKNTAKTKSAGNSSSVQIKSLAEKWASKAENNWPISYGDIGPLFLVKALVLCRPEGKVAMVQPCSTLLYNGTSEAVNIRTKLFSGFQVMEIINLAAIRYHLFANAAVPACIIVINNIDANGSGFWYSCPKQQRDAVDNYRFVIEPQDVNFVYPDEVSKYPWLWSTLLWASRRDFLLINRLKSCSTISSLEDADQIVSQQGVIIDTDGFEVAEMANRPFLGSSIYQTRDLVYLPARSLSFSSSTKLHRRTNMRAFEHPQLLLKETWSGHDQRFHALIVEPDVRGGVVPNGDYLSIHSANTLNLWQICLTFNSILAVYFLLLTSGRFAMDRNQPNTGDIKLLPLPELSSQTENNINSFEDIDLLVQKAFDLQEVDWTLIEDLNNITLPDQKGNVDSPGRLATERGEEHEMFNYCRMFCDILHGNYGDDKYVGAEIFTEVDEGMESARMVSFFLNVLSKQSVSVEAMSSPELQRMISKIYTNLLSVEENRHQFYQRTVRTYQTLLINESGEISIRINIIKPDKVRFWTRSMAMRDADEVVADLIQSANSVSVNSEAEEVDHA